HVRTWLPIHGSHFQLESGNDHSHGSGIRPGLSSAGNCSAAGHAGRPASLPPVPSSGGGTRRVLRTKVRPEVESATRRTQKAYEEGNVNYFLVLETTRQLIDSRNREAQLDADLRRTWADLERSVGR